MGKTDIDKFLELLADIVSGEGSYTEKRDALLAAGDEADRVNLEEFASWFDV